MEKERLFSMSNIEKSFGPVHVLKKARLEINKGEIHAFMGENGAGKSTLMNILAGLIDKDEGEIIFEGKEIPKMTPDFAQELGIAFVHQELNLAEDLSVAENIFIGRLPYKNKALGIVDFKKLYEDTQQWLNLVGSAISPTTLVASLSTANKQLVEIARALSLNAKVIIFDEPTTSLSEKDVEVLFIIIRRLKEKGVSSIYISHRMKEIFELGERITIMRDGEYILTDEVKNLSEEAIIARLVGREINDLYPKQPTQLGETYLQVLNLSDSFGRVKNVSFQARRGEVLGFAGLVGSGRTETMRLIFGADRAKSGEIKLANQPVVIKSPVDAIRQGIGLLTEDRKHQGLFLGLSIQDNITITNLGGFVLKHESLNQTAHQFVQDVKIKISDIARPVASLSGGNQQKVVLAKWLNTTNQVYIFDEPTKGIDVGAKSEIYTIINELARQGKTILIVSSEIPELLGICDRIHVFREGEITGEVVVAEYQGRKDEAQELIMTYATLNEH
ncbi:sugar ABC transporter ATP-binding protein [Enterococcus mundtii]|uniref:Ribose import ATP-binding protein RbsA n=1 Tax=Enterococcus mundtii TaxID=53346 RepID=A0A1L8V0E3_ENTMU|nr:sugar ABC transporter ATP-binding protein [Enterococcus mundtii]GEN17814.1 ribose import ATP-binding protein RbsA [Ligilactobacillus acidipiscis]AUB53932.1 D-xylose ABC transporter ATP-binding protein [Enterococcus mundtii]MZZ59099.1 ATP-binding cassette domain-containing protein [Enterococcus mundtii]MZZ62097.1 ATP-binding cassette domain-containing protein [Enterococcus mundtii]MZZ69177.1 ATP-binding cassette domain-containing protein [Enterococcus mundtii]